MLKIAYAFRHPLGDGVLVESAIPNNGGYYVTQGYLENDHLGEDWNRIINGQSGSADTGEPIYAIANGEVIYSKSLGAYNNGWGNSVILRHTLPDGSVVYSQYNHLDSVSVGSNVSIGEQIGTMGNTGNSTDAHLHFEIHTLGLDGLNAGYSSNTTGYLDPTDFINEHRSIARLSPENSVDFTQDRGADVLWRSTEDGAVGYWNITNGQKTWIGLKSSTETDWSIVGTGDFSADESTDVLWRNSVDGAVGYWDVSGASTQWVGLSGETGASWNIVGTGDITGDGRTDIIWRNKSGGEVGYWDVVDGVSTEWVSIKSSTYESWEIVGTGDFTADGTTDILWRDAVDGAVGYWNATEDSTGWVSLKGRTELSWTIQGIGDFSGDGTSDILWQSLITGSVGYWDIDLDGSIHWLSLKTSTDRSWTIEGTEDFSGDGKSDVLWRNTNDGAVGYWKVSDTKTDWVGLASATHSDWEIYHSEVDNLLF